MTFPSRKTREKGEVIAHIYGIFYQFRSTLVITHTIAIKWKEKYHAVEIPCSGSKLSPQLAFLC